MRKNLKEATPEDQKNPEIQLQRKGPTVGHLTGALDSLSVMFLLPSLAKAVDTYNG